MHQLIKVQETKNGQTVSARDLHQFLVVDSLENVVGEDFSHWIKRMLSYGFIKNQDYTILEYDYKGAKISESDSQLVKVHKRDYALTLGCSKEISMLQKNDKGKQARKYFIACEKALKESAYQLPKNFSDALRMLADETEQKALLLEENYKLQEKTALMDRVLDADEKIDIGQAAKILELPFGRNTMFKKLRERGIFFKNRNEPQQTYIKRGFFVMKEKFIERNNHDGFVILKVLVTQKGLEFLNTIFKSTRAKSNLAKIS